MTEIYLIRHTQAEGNRYRMMQGYWDGEVTAWACVRPTRSAGALQSFRWTLFIPVI